MITERILKSIKNEDLKKSIFFGLAWGLAFGIFWGLAFGLTCGLAWGLACNKKDSRKSYHKFKRIKEQKIKGDKIK